MVTKIKKWIKKIQIRRTTILMMVFLCMSLVLVNKLFHLQIIDGEQYVNQFSSKTVKTRTLNSMRGNIYDRNGNILAYNKLSYSLTLEDNGTYDTNREKNLTLNGVAYQIIQMLAQYGDSLDNNFHVILNDQGLYTYDVDGTNLSRFRADIYGCALIDDMTKKQSVATADELMNYLTGDERFSIVLTGKSAYTSEELTSHGLPEELTKEEILQIAMIRYSLSTNSFRKYMPVTLASDISEEMVAAVMENQNALQGIDVAEDSIRYYEDSEYFSSIIGYTGKASTDELESLQEENSAYNSNSIIGKTGIEQYMETDLQGVDGEEKVYVDNLGKVLKIDEKSKIEPSAGHDVYLSIDKNLQEAVYKILEQRIAGILVTNIVAGKTFDYESTTDASQVRIPIYDVYNALIANSVIDITHFTAEDAGDNEKNIFAKFQQKQTQVFGIISNELTGASPSAYSVLDDETKEYLDYIVDDLLTSKLGILKENAIDYSDSVYKAYTKEGSISLQEYLTYAASQNWIDISSISPDGDYLDSKEVYQSLSNYLAEYLTTDNSFSKIVYKYMLQQDLMTPEELCLTLYEQGTLSTDDDSFESFVSGQMSAYDFMIQKISNLEITPGQLALDPCSGSAVITDPNSGEVLACVTYPGYDNNRLSNTMDTDYYNKLVNDLSQPFFNKATQQRTAPGSTFKLCSTIAGLDSKTITEDTYINCDGSFDLITPSINCWNKAGHGALEIKSAIEQSCNVFFTTIGYEMGLDTDGKFSDSRSLQQLSNYASLLDLDKKSGIEITESEPKVSDDLAVPSYIGQGTHLYTTSELARYVTTITNSGTSYKLSLLDKVTDSDGNVLTDYSPGLESTVDIDSYIWDDLHEGMRRVVQTHGEFADVGLEVAGKTGTAQESEIRPDHGLFVGYAPYNNPTVSMAVRIAHGYSSGNACLVAADILKYEFKTKDEKDIITGTATTTTSTTSTD